MNYWIEKNTNSLVKNQTELSSNIVPRLVDYHGALENETLVRPLMHALSFQRLFVK